MSGEHSNANLHDAIGADAVCAQCGTVNPEGVFICRTCGNNLRDQRALRLSAEQKLMEGTDAAESRQWHFTSGLAVVGLLVVLLTGLNVDRISDWLVRAQNPRVDPIAPLWEGVDAADFVPLAAELQGLKPSEEAYRAARESAGRGIETGLYAVFYEEAPVGTAAVELRAQDLLFAAQLDNGAEVRGMGTIGPNNGLVVQWDHAGVYWNDDYHAVAGAGLVRDDGAIECFGQSDWDGASFEFAVYRLPSE